MQSFILTFQEHRARAMLLGLMYLKHTHTYAQANVGYMTWGPNRLDADTLEPVNMMSSNNHTLRADRVRTGMIGCKGSEGHLAFLERSRQKQERRRARCQPS